MGVGLSELSILWRGAGKTGAEPLVRSTNAQEQLHAHNKQDRPSRAEQQGRVGEVSDGFLCQDLEAKLFKWFESRFDAPRIVAARHKELVASGKLKEGYDEGKKTA